MKKWIILYAVLSLFNLGCNESEIYEDEYVEINNSYTGPSLLQASEYYKSSEDFTGSFGKDNSVISGGPIWNLNIEINNEDIDDVLSVPYYLNEINFDNVHSRVLFRDNNGEIESIIFTRVFDTKNTLRGSFNGKIFFHTKSGEYLSGFKIEDGNIVSEFLSRQSTSSSKGGDDDCTSPGCSLGEGEEVVVYGNRPNFDSYYSSWVDLSSVSLDAGEISGGGGSAESVNGEWLCGQYVFKETSSGQLQANISGIGARFAGTVDGVPLFEQEVSYPSLCFTLPANTVIPEHLSKVLADAYRGTVLELMVYATDVQDVSNQDYAWWHERFLDFFVLNINAILGLKYYNTGAIISRSNCLGAPHNNAKYC
ncbi:hypothetical protein [uncultured Croceitalea sp.]|uniref:hypothetical protein n=1 Tax=uncultured Croceitalea sp. TaxID=1798908 RepID=UPI0033066730